MTMNKRLNLITLISMSILFGACNSNTIYFNISNQTINTCSGRPITSLYIEKSDYSEYGTFTVERGKQGTSRFKISLQGGGYIFDPGSSEHMLVITPNSKFVIRNVSNGDAAGSQIIITTDSKGRVITATKTDCN